MKVAKFLISALIPLSGVSAFLSQAHAETLAPARSDATSKFLITPSQQKKAEPKSYILGENKIKTLGTDEFSGHVQAQLGFYSESYLADKADLNGYNEFQMIHARIKAHAGSSSFKVGADVGGDFSANVTNDNSFYVAEAFAKARLFEYGSSANASLTVGREKQTWNELDTRWSTGKFQPLYHPNPLHPTEMGLTGTFLAAKGETYQIEAFYSPLFLPEQGATVTTENGHVSSPNPWFNQPTSSIQIYQGQAPIQYNIMTPSISSVVNNTTVGGKIEIGRENAGAFARASYLNGPKNNLLLPFSGYLKLGADSVTAPVTVYPQVVNHQLAGGDVGYRAKMWQLSLSGVYEETQNPRIDPTLTSQVTDPMFLLSPSLDFKTGTAFWAPQFGVSYYQQFGGLTHDVGPYASSQTPIFPDAMMFHQAAQLSAKSMVFREGAMKAELSVKGIQDFRDLGTVLEGDFKFWANSYLALNIGGDFLGSNAEPSSSAFTSRFRGNDNVFGGVQVLF